MANSRILATGTVMALAASFVPAFALAAPNQAENRIAGADRIDTAIAVKKSFTEWSDTALIARADTFADSLSGSALSGALRAPIFLTSGTKLDVRVAANLREGGFKNVILLGGNGAISDQVAADINSSGFKVSRLGGANRYETSLLVAQQVLAKTGKKTVLLAAGENYPDALSAGAAAAKTGAAILLAPTTTGLDTTSRTFLAQVNAGVITVGGPAAQAAKISGLKAQKSLTGANRFDTAVKVAQEFFANASQAMLASGLNFPDALAAASVAGLTGRPLVLGTAQSTPKETAGYLREAGISSAAVHLVGGPGAVVHTEAQSDKPSTPGTSGGNSAGGSQGNSGGSGNPSVPGNNGNPGANPAPNPGVPGGNASDPADFDCKASLPEPVLQFASGSTTFVKQHDAANFTITNSDKFNTEKCHDDFSLSTTTNVQAGDPENLLLQHLIGTVDLRLVNGQFRVELAEKVKQVPPGVYKNLKFELSVQRNGRTQVLKLPALNLVVFPDLELSSAEANVVKGMGGQEAIVQVKHPNNFNADYGKDFQLDLEVLNNSGKPIEATLSGNSITIKANDTAEVSNGKYIVLVRIKTKDGKYETEPQVISVNVLR